MKENLAQLDRYKDQVEKLKVMVGEGRTTLEDAVLGLRNDGLPIEEVHRIIESAGFISVLIKTDATHRLYFSQDASSRSLRQSPDAHSNWPCVIWPDPEPVARGQMGWNIVNYVLRGKWEKVG